MRLAHVFLSASIAGVLLSVTTHGAVAAEQNAIAEEMWDKAIADNAARASSAYAAYRQAVRDALPQVIKALQQDLANLNDARKFPDLDIQQRAEAISALQERIDAAKESDAVAEAAAEQSGESAENLETILSSSKWRWEVPGQGISAQLVFQGDGSVINPWGEPWKYETKGKKLTIRLYGSASSIKESVFMITGNTDKATDRLRVSTLIKEE